MLTQDIIKKISKPKKQRPEGLTKKEVKIINKAKYKTLSIRQTIPFAPFIFIGALLSILTKNNIIIYIINLLQ
jgi:prepilin signal peptidase PulO-like enzyme (type II secretory pathway)